MKIPTEVEARVVAHLYSDADQIGWSDLSVVERSAQYATWVASPSVGGLLTEFISASEARVWIKDGPMKEWSRARSGVGKYAHLMPEGAQTPERLVRSGMGAEWQIEPGSLLTKPLRVVARNDEDEVTFTWGPMRDFKHLIWAALQASGNRDPATWVLCVADSFTRPVPANVRQMQLRIAERCDLRLVYVTV